MRPNFINPYLLMEGLNSIIAFLLSAPFVIDFFPKASIGATFMHINSVVCFKVIIFIFESSSNDEDVTQPNTRNKLNVIKKKAFIKEL